MRVTCQTCWRQERWEDGRVTVEVEGGGRRPAIDPQWARGLTALAAARGEGGPVVAVCEACGQLMVADDATAPGIDVRVDTPHGPLSVNGGRVTGPHGPLSDEEAQAFLREQYEVSEYADWRRDLLRLPLFFGMVGPLVLLVFCVMIVWTFFAGLVQEPPAAVTTRGSGWDMPATPAP